MMELLAPAGGMEQLRHALHYGADAVYLGGSRFGLRERADNFPGVELASAISLAHEHGKKAYVTTNALIHQHDLMDFRAYCEDLEAMGADAAIVSDPSAIGALRKHAPHVAIHISTQASIVNAYTARLYHDLGASRVVLARELTLEEIAAIRANTPADLEIEVFVHGAMCIAYSGRCLISNYLVGRDANRGHCTQPCRWKWSLQEETRPGEYFPIEEDGKRSFVMSSADLNMLEHLDELQAAGVDSIKIEGRVKGAYYVATVTNAYRRVLDGESPDRWKDELHAVSHRPYHTGFYYGTPAQSYDGKEYFQTCDFVGTVIESTPIGDETYRTAFVLRNRLFKDDELEVLSPTRGILRIHAHDLTDEDGLPCRTATHNARRYEITSEFQLSPLDIIRKRRGDPDVQAGRSAHPAG
ncbi:MAG: U32 family peptidase [Coriobacteriia bacterium]|nr:U32 family peptidase [Coriobacteriia bacterium]